MMTNAVTAKIDWHENARFNGGLSALELYKKQAWVIDAQNKELVGQARHADALQSLQGTTKLNLTSIPPKMQVAETIQDIAKKGVFSRAKNWFNSLTLDKRYGAVTAGIIGLAAIIYAARRITTSRK